MSKKLLLCFVAGLLIGLAIVFPRWYPGSSRDSINSVTLYSLDGTGLQKYQPAQIKEQFHGFPVLGKIELTGSQRDLLLDALEEGIAGGSGIANCFWPRHGIQFERDGAIVDHVICFHCLHMKVYTDGEEKTVLTNRKPKSLFNQVLLNAGIPLAPAH